MLKIGYLGPRGTFSQEALLKYAKDMEYTPREFLSISEILEAVDMRIIDEAVVPIENSIEGAINATMDIIALENDLRIKAELLIPIREHLLVKKGTNLSAVKTVLSHPQPLGQCRRFLSKHFPDAIIKATDSTASAAEEVSKGKGDSAAIGSFEAAKAYDMEIAQQDIQDFDNNTTRFIVVAREDNERTGKDKTSIVFSTEDKPGSLYKILEIFNLWDINLSRIESRPAKNKLGSYIFFVDLSGHKDDDDLRDALAMVKRKTSFYKFLGSYPVSS